MSAPVSDSEPRIPEGPAIPELGKPVSRLALGTAFYTPDQKETLFPILDAFRAHGGSVLDTGVMYKDGGSEQTLAAWLDDRDARSALSVFTKVCHGTPGTSFTPEEFHKTLEEEIGQSHANLRTDCLDVVLLHRDHPRVPVRDILEAFNDQVQRGRIRCFGGSNWTYERLDEMLEAAEKHGLRRFDLASNNFSLPVPTGPFYKGLISCHGRGEQWHDRHGIANLSWSTQARGFFTDRYNENWRRNPPADETGFDANMRTIYGTDANYQRRRRAERLGQDRGGYTAMEVGLAWVLHRPSMIAVAGAHNLDEFNSCLKAFTLSLTPAESAWLNLETDDDPLAV